MIRNPVRRTSPLDLPPLAKLVAYVLLFGWAFVVLFPLYWIVITSFKTPIQVNSGPVYIPFLDFQPTLENWRYIFVDLRSDTLRPYVNTIVVGLTSSVLALALGSSAASAIVCFRYRPRGGVIALFVGCGAFAAVARRFRRALGNNDVAFWLISQRILPPVAVVIPIYVLFQRLGLLDTWQALIIAYVATNLPIVVWLMRDYFSTVPIELEESAAVDGASPYRIFRSIVLPVSVPGLVAKFLFVLVFAWNEYLLALFLSSARAQTLPLTVAAQNATRGPQWWYMSVLILIMIVPVIVVAIVLERFISRGVLVGAVKG
jgi:multiple sugar transport system permease protein